MRLGFEARPVEGLSIVPSLFYERLSYGSSDTVTLGLPDYSVNDRVSDSGSDTMIVPSLTVNYDMGFATVTSVTSDYTRNSPYFYDGTAFNSVYIGQCFLDGLCGSPPVTDLHGHLSGSQIEALAAPAHDVFYERQAAEELRMSSRPYTGTGLPISWVTGIYLVDSRSRADDVEYIDNFNPTFTSLYGSQELSAIFGGSLPNEVIYQRTNRFEEKQYSVFGDFSYYVTHALRLSVGARYLTAYQSFERTGDGFFNGGPTSDAASAHDHAATPRLSVNYEINDETSVYTTMSKGFRLGAPNPLVPTQFCAGDLANLGLTAAPSAYSHEDLWNYEAGISKSQPARWAAINASGFYIRVGQAAAVVQPADLRLRVLDQRRLGAELRSGARADDASHPRADDVRYDRLYQCDLDGARRLDRHRAGALPVERRAALERERRGGVEASSRRQSVRVRARQLQLHGREPWGAAHVGSRLPAAVLRPRRGQLRGGAARLGIRRICDEPLGRAQDHPDARPRGPAGGLHPPAANRRHLGIRQVLAMRTREAPRRRPTPGYSAWSLLRARLPPAIATGSRSGAAGDCGMPTTWSWWGRAAMGLPRPIISPVITAFSASACWRGTSSATAMWAATLPSYAPTTCCPRITPSTRTPFRRWETLSRDQNYNVMNSPRGVLDLANSDDDMAVLARRGNAMRLAGIDAELLDRKGIGRFAPELEPERPRRFPLVGGLLQRRGGTVRHDAVAWGYARAAAALGVDFIERCEVQGLSAAGGVATGVETSCGPVKAERVVFAVAGHTGTIGTMLGSPLPVETHLLQAMVTEPIKPLLSTVLVYPYPHGEVYLTQSDRGGIVMGGFLDGFPSYTREGRWHRLESVVQGGVELLPRIGGLKLLRSWAGTNDMTMDGSFIIDRIKHDNVLPERRVVLRRIQGHSPHRARPAPRLSPRGRRPI